VIPRGIFVQQVGTITPTADSSMIALRDVFGDRILLCFVACWLLPTGSNLVTFCKEVCKKMHIKKGLTESTGFDLLEIMKHFKEFSTIFSPVMRHVSELKAIFSVCCNMQ
jgi:hypothetical protein